MVSMYLWTVVARSHYKFLLILFLGVVSCSRSVPSIIEVEGEPLSVSNVFVDGVGIDVISYGSGKLLWRLHGTIVLDGKENPYAIFYDRDPRVVNAQIVHLEIPNCFRSDDRSGVRCVVTFDGPRVAVSWRENKCFMLVRSALISAH